jgi:hypothetical protein
MAQHYVEIVIRDENDSIIARRQRMDYPSALAYLQHWECIHPLSDCKCRIEEEETPA